MDKPAVNLRKVSPHRDSLHKVKVSKRVSRPDRNLGNNLDNNPGTAQLSLNKMAASKFPALS